MSSQRQPRLGITNTTRTTSNTVPMAQNTWQGEKGVSHGAALVNTVCNSRATVDKVIILDERILEVRKVRMAVPFLWSIWNWARASTLSNSWGATTLHNICGTHCRCALWQLWLRISKQSMLCEVNRGRTHWFCLLLFTFLVQGAPVSFHQNCHSLWAEHLSASLITPLSHCSLYGPHPRTPRPLAHWRCSQWGTP